LKNEKLLLFILVIILTLPLFNTDVYLPAFPAILKSFNAKQASVQTTISLYLLGLGLSQLFYGPLSDRFGRKPILVFGITIYILGTLMCLFANHIYLFQLFRFVEGIGISVGSVLGRVVIVDIYKEKSANIFTIVFPLAVCSPAIAPFAGGILVHIFHNWQSCFILLLIFAIFALYLIIYKLPETVPETVDKNMTIRSVFFNYLLLMKSLLFWGYATVFIAAYVFWYIYVVETPFIFHSMQLNPLQIGLAYFPLTFGFYFGNKLANKLSKKLSLNKIIFVGFGIFLIATISYLVQWHLYFWNSITIIMTMFLVTVANGFLVSFSIAGALNTYKLIKTSSYGSSLIGFMQLTISAITTYTLVHLSETHSVILFISILIVTVFIALGLLFIRLGRTVF
jgi:DHA1 family bicyclomycin/chloramphenicol resistance-like MFS transporter